MPGDRKTSRRSIRIPGFDYSGSSSYFITICTHNRKPIFGKCVADKIHLFKLGELVVAYWSGIPDHFRQVELDEFVIMPNHIHGIIHIHPYRGRGTACRAPTVEEFGQPVAGSLPTIVRSFKSAVTRDWRLIAVDPDYPVWQRNYYEHVVRDREELNHLRQYISHNPMMWNSDPLYGWGIWAKHQYPGYLSRAADLP